MRKTPELAHLFRALKSPAAARALPALAERAREEQWSYERFAELLSGTEVSARESHGGEGRIKTARFPASKTLEEFDLTFQRSVKKTVIEHFGQLDFLHARENVILLGPPGTGKTHLAIAASIRVCLAGQRIAFATATECARTARRSRLAVVSSRRPDHSQPASEPLTGSPMIARSEDTSIVTIRRGPAVTPSITARRTGSVIGSTSSSLEGVLRGEPGPVGRWQSDRWRRYG